MGRMGYFPGCSLERSSGEYDKSVRFLCGELGIELADVPDWSCCGVHAAAHHNPILSAALGARNLNQAIAGGAKNLLAPCPSCYNRLKVAQRELTDNPNLQKEFNKEFDFKYDPQLEVFSILELLSRERPVIKSRVKRNINLKLVAYYGCLLVRPPDLVRFDHPENPVSMDNLLSGAGYKMLPWDYKVACCGASLAISDPPIHTKLSGDILEMAHLAGAQAIALACPLCHVNLDLKQGQINRRRKSDFNMPVFYFTQLLGLAFGASPQEMGIDKHMVDALSLLKEAGIG